jgi:hypothetical protein
MRRERKALPTREWGAAPTHSSLVERIGSLSAQRDPITVSWPPSAAQTGNCPPHATFVNTAAVWTGFVLSPLRSFGDAIQPTWIVRIHGEVPLEQPVRPGREAEGNTTYRRQPAGMVDRSGRARRTAGRWMASRSEPARAYWPILSPTASSARI